MAIQDEDRKFRQEIGRRIRYALTSKNVTQAELAKAIGAFPCTISCYVSGTRTPNSKQIVNIARYLGVSADYLLGLNDADTHCPIPFDQKKIDAYERAIRTALDKMCIEIRWYWR